MLRNETTGYRASRTVADQREEPGLLAMEEFFEKEAGEAGGVVADDAVFLEEVVEDHAEAELLKDGKINGHRFCTLRTITPSHIGRDALAVSDDPIDDPARDVFLDGAEVIGKGVAGGFAGLGHKIGDIDARCLRLGDGGGNLRDQQIGKNAGVKRAGAEENQVGLLYGFDGFGERAHAARRKLESLDGGAAGGDARFAVDGAS